MSDSKAVHSSAQESPPPAAGLQGLVEGLAKYIKNKNFIPQASLVAGASFPSDMLIQ